MRIDKKTLLKKLMSYKYVTFDIFDTLVSRCVLNPSDVIKLIDTKVSNQLKLPINSFQKFWLKSTNFLRMQNKSKDTTFSQIYDRIKQISGFSLKTIEEIKNIHLQTELSLVTPRQEILDIYNKLIKFGKKIIIVSDMYYPSEFLKKLLNKCGYFKFEKIIVSNEYQATKFSGKLWNQIIKQYPGVKFIHVGDSKRSDYLKVKHVKQEAIKINAGRKISSKSYLNISNSGLIMSLMYGTIINKCLFNSPFKNHHQIIDSPKKFGYSILGPVFFYFYNWLFKNIKTSQFLFISREGWYLQKMYNEYKNVFAKFIYKSAPKSIYLYASRRAVLAASIKTWEDIKFVCKFKLAHFKGDSRLFFKSKFDLTIDNSENFTVSVSKTNRILQLAKKYQNLIIKNAKNERKNYLAYLKKNVTNGCVLVDYSGLGTIQYFLSKIMNKKITGVYISKAPSKKIEKLGIKRIGAFPFQIKNIFTLGIIGNIFESFLVAPHGQFLKIDSNQKPVFANDVLTNHQCLVHDQVYDGVISFFKDLSKIIPDNLLITPSNAKTIFNLLNKFYLNFKSKPICDDLIDFFALTDIFSGQASKKFIKKK